MSLRETDVAIVGGGPRGLAVLEALSIYLERHARPGLRIVLFDSVEPGAGRIWRTDQPTNLLMNTLASQVTMFSRPGKDTSVPGRGPSLHDWLAQESKDEVPLFARRCDYGRYLRFVLDSVVTWLRLQGVDVQIEKDFVVTADQREEWFQLYCTSSRAWAARKVVLCTGHSRLLDETGGWEGKQQENYYSGDSCADMDLNRIPAGATVGVKGLGLGFLDVMSTLTEGRGGTYSRLGHGLQYISSGQEPVIYAGSRSGLPIPPRAVNQKVNYKHEAVFFSDDYLLPLLEKGGRGLSFSKDLLPLLIAEMEHVYYRAHVRNIKGDVAAIEFERLHREVRNPFESFEMCWLDCFELGCIVPFDLDYLKSPFAGKIYTSFADFSSACSEYLEADMASAKAGNIFSPLKAALDVLRDIRDRLRQLVEFEGLTSKSWYEEFTGDFASTASLLAAGPPLVRVEELLALMRAGIVRLVGPGMRINAVGGEFEISSPAVEAGSVRVEWLIDARTPFPSLSCNGNLLIQNLLGNDLVQAYKGERGGIEICGDTHEVINPREVRGLFALGIPTEGPKWFTQVGSATPGKFSNFSCEAYRLVAALLSVEQLRP